MQSAPCFSEIAKQHPLSEIWVRIFCEQDCKKPLSIDWISYFIKLEYS
jgi:hypothetical protein